MKKICLTLVLFSFISVMPSFAVKLIVNDSSDRIVPSRSSNVDAISNLEYMEEVPTEQQIQPAVHKSELGYQGEKYELIYKPLLSKDLRPELVGTTWNYPDYSHLLNVSQVQEVEQMQETEYVPRVVSKKYTREAADYYMIDTNVNPKQAVMAGFELLVEE